MLAFSLTGGPVAAYDPGEAFSETCCADLESRIAELEASTSHGGSDIVEIEISGQVHRSLLSWSDGFESNTYGVDPTTGGTYVEFAGSADTEDDWEAGFLIQIDLQSNVSDELSQDRSAAPASAELGIASLYLRQEDWGGISLGRQSEAHDHVTETDLADIELVAAPAVSDWNGSFRLNGRSAAKFEAEDFTWSTLQPDHIGDGEEASVVRLDGIDIDETGGLSPSLSWGNGDVTALALRGLFLGDAVSLEFAAAVAHYGAPTRSPCEDLEPRAGCVTAAGSLSIRHHASGLGLKLAAARVLDDPNFPTGFSSGPNGWFYSRASWAAPLTGLGETAFYAEHYRGERHGLIFLADDRPNGDDIAEFHSQSEVNGLGIVQTFEAAEMKIYAGWRLYSIEGSATSGPNGEREAFLLDDYSAFLTGARIEF